MQLRRMSQQALGVAALLWVAAAPKAWSQTPTGPTAVARDYVQQNKQGFGLTGSDVNEMVVSSEVASRHNGVTHVYLQQQYRGIDVQDGIITVNVACRREGDQRRQPLRRQHRRRRRRPEREEGRHERRGGRRGAPEAQAHEGLHRAP